MRIEDHLNAEHQIALRCAVLLFTWRSCQSHADYRGRTFLLHIPILSFSPTAPAHQPSFHSRHTAGLIVLQGLCTCCLSVWASFPRLAPSCHSGFSSKDTSFKSPSHIILSGDLCTHFLSMTLSYHPALFLHSTCHRPQHLIYVFFSFLMSFGPSSPLHYKFHVSRDLFCLDHFCFPSIY